MNFECTKITYDLKRFHLYVMRLAYAKLIDIVVVI